ncbi:hypothetical protein R6Q57_003096 [Mikania cordata]
MARTWETCIVMLFSYFDSLTYVFISNKYTKYTKPYTTFLRCLAASIAHIRIGKTIQLFSKVIFTPNNNGESYRILPTRSHPILFQLKYHLNQLKFHWASDALSKSFDSDRVSDALVRLRIILESLDDLLDQTLSRDSLHRHHDWVEKVLKDFLLLVDVYGTFQMQISTLKQCIINAQLAAKRKDVLKKIVCVNGSHDDLEIVGAIEDVIEVIIMTSESIFSGIYGSFETRKTSWMMGMKKSKTGKGIKEVENGIWSLRNYRDEDLNKKMMQEMEECIDGIEGGSERVFRSLINTRVSLLNVLTQ